MFLGRRSNKMTVSERNLIIDDIISMLQKMEKNNSKQEEQEINLAPRLNCVSKKDTLHNYVVR